MFWKRKENAENGKRKRIKGVAVLDLTNYTPQALRNIKSISGVACVLVADGDEEYIEALSEIEIEGVACTIKVPKGTEIASINGSARLTNETAKKDTIYNVNGFALIYDLSADMNIGLIVNGMALVQKGSNVNVLQANGEVITEEFDIDKLKFVDNKLYIDANFVKECEVGTIAMADNKIYIDDSVTADMLCEKKIRFISGNKIICRKELWGYVQNNAHIGNKIAESDEINTKSKKKRK